MADFSGRLIVLALRIAQFIFAIIALGLTGYVSNWWTGYWHSTSASTINFLIFDAAWTILALAYLLLVPWRFPDSGANHKFAILALEAVTMLFWFAGWVALAVWVTDRLCRGPVCACAKAATVFGAFEWLLFVATTVLAVLHVLRTRDRSSRQADKADPNLNVSDSV